MRAYRPSVADSARAANPSQLAAVASYPLEDRNKDDELAKESADPSQIDAAAMKVRRRLDKMIAEEAAPSIA